MAIEGLSSLPTQGISGVSGLSRTDEERRRSRNTSGDDAALDPRAGFDASLESMLADASGVSAAPSTTPRTASRTDDRTQDRFTRTHDDAPATYNAAGRLSGAQTVALAGSAGGTLASEPVAVPQAATAGTDDSNSKKNDSAGGKLAGDLSPEEEKQVEQLRQRDQEVRAHEQAHQATGGEHAGGISYTYQRGPDNRQYAVGGSVPIDVSPVADDPEATVAKAEKVRAAAMAPASPSGADQQVAAKASQMAAKARAEQAEKSLNPDEDENGAGKPGEFAKPGELEKSGESRKPGDPAKPGESGPEDTALGVSKAEKAAEAGLTALNLATANASRPDMADRTANAAELRNGISQTDSTAGASGAAGASGVVATNPLLQPPRPATHAQSMPYSQDTPRDGTASSASPSAQATRAAYVALQHMGQAATPAAQPAVQAENSANAGNPETLRRALGKASAAYARVRGETGLAPLNTGISMAV